jgi:hypothetical protein
VIEPGRIRGRVRIPHVGEQHFGGIREHGFHANVNGFPRDGEQFEALRGALFTIVESGVFGWRLIGSRPRIFGIFALGAQLMPNERISMSKLKQLIGLQSSNLGVRAMGRALGLSMGAVSKYLRAVRVCGIEAAEAETLPEHELERRVFGPLLAAKPARLVPPDCAWIHGELKRHRHVTLQLLWEEYSSREGAAAYRRSAFCQIYRRWEKRLKRSMRQRHFAGEMKEILNSVVQAEKAAQANIIRRREETNALVLSWPRQVRK